MSINLSPNHISRLVHSLASHTSEADWFEFKHNNCDPEMIGKICAGISNTCALAGREAGYIVWGIEDGTHRMVGTDFVPGATKKGNEMLVPWLMRYLEPRIAIQFHQVKTTEGVELVVLEIPAPTDRPVSFFGTKYIRVGSTTKPLVEYPEKERALWRVFDTKRFEDRVALQDLSADDVLELLDYGALSRLLHRPQPNSNDAMLGLLSDEGVICPNDAGRWDISNLGGILFARDLSNFPALMRKALRIIFYDGKDRTKTKRELCEQLGYAAGLDGLMRNVGNMLPTMEAIDGAIRRSVPMFPELAVRELIANALIHQDFAISGAGPMLEVFDDRIEVTNPGTPLGDIQRLLDQPPRSRNEKLAALMRRMGLCEERGSGVDKVVSEAEASRLPPPQWIAKDQAARAILFAPKALRQMTKDDLTRACYQHACLLHERHEALTNTSLRERLGVEPKNAATVSRIIGDTEKAGLILPFDPAQGKRNSRYKPYWA